jgi:hypothetical protein
VFRHIYPGKKGAASVLPFQKRQLKEEGEEMTQFLHYFQRKSDTHAKELVTMVIRPLSFLERSDMKNISHQRGIMFVGHPQKLQSFGETRMTVFWVIALCTLI